MLLISLCLALWAFGEEVKTYEGTLRVEARQGDCEDGVTEQKVTLLLAERDKGFQGYLIFQDKRLARVEGAVKTNLRLRFPAAEPELAEIWSLHLATVEGKLTGRVQALREQGKENCRMKQARLQLQKSDKDAPSIDKWSRIFEALNIVERVHIAFEVGDSHTALAEAERAIQLGTGHEEIHLAAAAVIMTSEKPGETIRAWLNAAEKAEQKNKSEISGDYRAVIAVILFLMGDEENLKKEYESALIFFGLAIHLNPNSHFYLAQAGYVCKRLGRRNEAVALLKKAVEAAVLNGDIDPSIYSTVNTYHTEILKMRSIIPKWAREETEKTNRVPDTPEVMGYLREWKEGNKLFKKAQREGKYRKGLAIAEENHKLARARFGVSHPHTLASLENLAGAYLKLGAYEAAQPLMEKALRFRQKVLGERHLDTLQSLNNLAVVYSKLGVYEAAQALYEKTLGLYQEVLGDRHPFTLRSLHNLASLYKKQGDYKAASSLYKKVLQLRQEVLGRHHPDTLQSLNNLAALYGSQALCARLT
ncbi:MAG: tetratricopeptide repeat protein [Acidobacteriota bacterium]|nr:tetratricopeptide repeat protein [Acidobacteriota bacterium]